MAQREQMEKERDEYKNQDNKQGSFTDGEQTRQIPENDLELNMMLTDSAWGDKDIIPPNLRYRLKNITLERGKFQDGEVITTLDDLWDLMGMYTRDMRLANISDTELVYCAYHIDLAQDLLTCGYPRASMKALSLSATVLELSQSKKGFLRNLFKTQKKEFKEEKERTKTDWRGRKIQEE